MPLLDRLLLLIDADGSRATTELDRLGRKTKETLTVGQQFGRDFFKGLGVGAGAISGFAVADAMQRLARFTIDATQAAEDDSRAQLVLSRTLLQTAGATKAQAVEVEGFISTTSKAVGVLDDELRPALATLVRSTNDVASAQRLLTLSLDISAATGRDLSTVSTALAKTWEGQTTALGRLLPEVGGLVREGASAKEILTTLQNEFSGTAEETAKSAGSFNRLKVQASELAETYGRQLIPVVQATSIGLQKVQDAASAPIVLKGLDSSIGVMRGFGQALGQSDNDLQKLVDSAKEAPIPVSALRARLDAVADSTGIFSAKLRELGFGMTRFAASSGITTSSVLGFEQSLRAAASAANSFLSNIFGVSSAEDKFNDALDDTTASTGGAVQATRDLIAEQFALERSARSVLQAEMDLVDAEKELEEVRKGASEREKKRASLDVTTAQNRVAQAQRQIAEATNELNRASGRRGTSDEAARARQALADAILEEERAREDLIDTEERANETMRRGTQGSEDLAAATKKVEDAQWGLKEAIESQRQSAQQDQTDGGPVGRSARQQRDSFREASVAAQGVITAMIEAGAPTDVINAKIADMVIKLQEAGTAAGVTKSEIKDAADLLIAFGAVAQAERQRSLTAIYGFGATTLTEELDAMRRAGIYIPDIAYRLAAGRAGGGPMNAGQTYRVGENGPETLTMGNSPGWMTPGVGNGPVINFNGTVVADKATLERLVFEALQAAQRRGWN